VIKIENENTARFTLYILPNSDLDEVSKIADIILADKMTYSLTLLTTTQNGGDLKGFNNYPSEPNKQSKIEKIVHGSKEHEITYLPYNQFCYFLWTKKLDEEGQINCPCLKDNEYPKTIVFGRESIKDYLKLIKPSNVFSSSQYPSGYSLDKD